MLLAVWEIGGWNIGVLGRFVVITHSDLVLVKLLVKSPSFMGSWIELHQSINVLVAGEDQ